MVKFLLLYLAIFSASAELGLSDWWSPYKWRHYWKDWWKELERGHSEGLTEPEESKPDLLPNDQG